MLSNTDFADLLKSGSSNGLTSDGKSRFGLEQVKTWDKQNDAKGKKKPSSFGKTPARGGDVADVQKVDKYRDRANERRKDVVTSEEAALEAVVSRLDAEQTKFLGGDVEHTHLVKGLDYALLRKIRDQEKVQNEDESEATTENKLEKELKNNSKQNALSTNKNVPIVKKIEGYKDFRTTSVMAETLKNMLLNPESSLNITRTASNVTKNSKNVADTFSRMAFDFDLSEDGESELPTIISRSKKEWEDGLDGESAVSCLLSIELGQKLSSVFGKSAISNTQNEKQNLKRKRKEQMLEEKQKILSTHKAPKVMIDDIFADVGKYVPVGALDEGEVEDEKEMNSEVVIEYTKEMEIDDNDNDDDNNIDSSNNNIINNNNSNNNDGKNEVQTVKGLFKNLIPSFPSKIKMSESTGSTVSAVKNIPEKVMTNAACVFDDDDDDDDDEKDIFIKKDTKISSKSNEKGSDRKTYKDEEGDDDDENEEDGERRIGDNKDDLMAPIRALLAAQSAKEKAALLRSEERASHRNDGFKNESKAVTQSSLAMGADGKSRVHRDVFGVVGSSGSTGVRRGEAMAHGSYDDYGGDNETYDSDHEDENEGKDKGNNGPKSAEEVENEGKDYKGKDKVFKARSSSGYDNDKGRGKDKDKEKDSAGAGGGKERDVERNYDSSGNWRNTDKDKERGKNKSDTHTGTTDKQSAIRPRVENNRAARRAGKS